MGFIVKGVRQKPTDGNVVSIEPKLRERRFELVLKDAGMRGSPPRLMSVVFAMSAASPVYL